MFAKEVSHPKHFIYVSKPSFVSDYCHQNEKFCYFLSHTGQNICDVLFTMTDPNFITIIVVTKLRPCEKTKSETKTKKSHNNDKTCGSLVTLSSHLRGHPVCLVGPAGDFCHTHTSDPTDL